MGLVERESLGAANVTRETGDGRNQEKGEGDGVGEREERR